MTIPVTRKSAPRFRRTADPSAIALQDDDHEILWQIYRHRLIDSKSLYQLFPTRSKQVISRRLTGLFRNDYIARPAVQNAKNRQTPGTDYFVYALENKGARELRDRFGVPVQSSRWTDKNGRLTVSTIEHHLEIARLVTKIVEGVRQLPNGRILYLDQLMPRDQLEKRPPGLATTLRADVPWFVHGQNEGTACDFILGVEVAGEQQILFIEIDRGTETIVPGDRQRKSVRFWRDTSFLRKMLIYSAAYRSKAHQKQFGLPVFRVLTVVPKPGRVSEMQDCYQRFLSRGDNHAPPGLFLFADWQKISTAENILRVDIENGVGRTIQFAR